MNKLIITLPAGGQVCIETDDRELVREVFYTFMPQLTGGNGDAPAGIGGINGEPWEPAATAYSNGSGADGGAYPPPPPSGDHNGANPATPVATPGILDAPAAPLPPTPAAAPHPTPPRSAPATPTAYAPVSPGEPARMPLPRPATELTTAAAQEFRAFCQRVNPLGDMRRVVVAAEAAARYLEVKSVDSDKLAELFTLADWPIPHSFVQTLRNAARTKFRWLERIPGIPGHYKVTNTGRSIVLGDGEAMSEPG